MDSQSESVTPVSKPSSSPGEASAPTPALNNGPDPNPPQSKEWSAMLAAIENFIISDGEDFRCLSLQIESKKPPFKVPSSVHQEQSPTYYYLVDLGAPLETDINKGVFSDKQSGTLEQAVGYWQEFPLVVEKEIESREASRIVLGKPGLISAYLWGQLVAVEKAVAEKAVAEAEAKAKASSDPITKPQE